MAVDVVLHGGPHDGWTPRMQAGDDVTHVDRIVWSLGGRMLQVYGAHDGPHLYRHEYGSIYRHIPYEPVGATRGFLVPSST